MLSKRIIPCLDVDDGIVMKGCNFKELKQIGDPVRLAEFYYREHADELIFLDIGASWKNRQTTLDIVEKISRKVFIPFTVGGGIRNIDDIRLSLLAGADKVSVCSAFLKNSQLIADAAHIFGSHCIVVSIDAKRKNDSWNCYANGGRINTDRDVVQWAKRCEQLGAGEILLNSIDSDGMKSGFDLDLIRTVGQSISIPVIASGGAGSPEHLYAALQAGRADAVLAASILHSATYSISHIKQYLTEKGVKVR